MIVASTGSRRLRFDLALLSLLPFPLLVNVLSRSTRDGDGRGDDIGEACGVTKNIRKLRRVTIIINSISGSVLALEASAFDHPLPA